MKTARNKTIDTTVEEGRNFLDRCVIVKEKQNDLSAVINKTLWGDMLEIVPFLPEQAKDETTPTMPVTAPLTAV